MTDYAHLSASLSSATPLMPDRMISANEETMWQSLAMDDVIFDVGTARNDVDD
jgi:hypothetical protein